MPNFGDALKLGASDMGKFNTDLLNASQVGKVPFHPDDPNLQRMWLQGMFRHLMDKGAPALQVPAQPQGMLAGDKAAFDQHNIAMEQWANDRAAAALPLAPQYAPFFQALKDPNKMYEVSKRLSDELNARYPKGIDDQEEITAEGREYWDRLRAIADAHFGRLNALQGAEQQRIKIKQRPDYGRPAEDK